MTSGRQEDSTRKSTFLIKQSLAAQLKEEIMLGNLLPGQRIVEGQWARRFGVAQTSVREAINLLISEGFVTKSSGRSARVTFYSEEDVKQIYQLRAAVEGLAAHLAAAQNMPDLTQLEAALADMGNASRQNDIRKLIETDLQFHLALCEASQNRILYQQARTLLVPLFAFVAMRAAQKHRATHAWESDLRRHECIVELIREGDPLAAEFTVRAMMQQFAARAYAIWQR